MKKLFSIFALALICNLTMLADKTVTLKGGTVINLEAAERITGKTAYVGQQVSFKVVNDVMADGTIVIPKGSIVHGEVTLAHRCLAFGIRGRLGIKIDKVRAVNGEMVPLEQKNIEIKGKNRMVWAIIIFCCTCVPYPAGTKATLKVGYKTDVTVLSNTELKIK